MLLAGDGMPSTEMAQRVDVLRPTVNLWWERYATSALAALAYQPRQGRPAVVDEAAIGVRTPEAPPQRLRVTHWSSWLLGKELGISNVTVAKIWKERDIQPCGSRRSSFTPIRSWTPRPVIVVGQYSNPPEYAIVPSVDEKSQVQAVDRTASMLPVRPGMPQRQTYDYVRHGTTTLFAALEVATGKRSTMPAILGIVTKSDSRSSRRSPPFIPAKTCTSSVTIMPPTIRAWIEGNPRITLHHTPTSGSWLNMVELFFSITRQVIRRGVSSWPAAAARLLVVEQSLSVRPQARAIDSQALAIDYSGSAARQLAV